MQSYIIEDILVQLQSTQEDSEGFIIVEENSCNELEEKMAAKILLYWELFKSDELKKIRN